MYILNVAEKPSVAKALSEILSSGMARSRNGFNRYCRIFEFKCAVAGAEADMVFTSVLGHLYGLEFEKKTLWTEIDPVELFEEKVRWSIPEAMEGVSKTIKTLGMQCKMLIIWTDCDREGENIGMQIAELVKGQIKDVRRARFSGLGKYEIHRALENLGTINTCESQAVQSRIEIDLRIGAAITRLQTLQLCDIVEKKAVISYGSCQIPTLGFVCEREETIENFIEEKNWTLQADVYNKGEKGTLKWDRGVMYDEGYVAEKMGMIEDGDLVVTKLETKRVEKWRPWPLRTVELQKFFAKSRGVSSSHELMNIAEHLYTSGYISYPRTETDAFPKGFNYKDPLNKLKNDSVLGEYARELVPGMPSAGKHNDQAHTPIYPIKDGSDLEGKNRSVYEYIARRFLAVYSKNAEGEEELLECTVKGEFFRRKTLKVIRRNYLDVFIYEKWGDAEPDLGLKLGQKVEWKAAVKDSKTEKPHLITESELITKMDNNGIGTDATIHDHIQRIKEREYIRVDHGNSLKSTWLGRSLIYGYKSIGLTISEPHLRKEFECNLKKVCNGSFSASELVQNEIIKYREIYRVIEKNMPRFQEEFIKNKQDPKDSSSPSEKDSRSRAYLENRFPKREEKEERNPKKTYRESSNVYIEKFPPKRKAYSNLDYSDIDDTVDSTYENRKKSEKDFRLFGQPIQKSGASTFNTGGKGYSSERSHGGHNIKDILRKDTGGFKTALQDQSNNSFVAQLPEGTIICDCNIEAKECKVNKEGPTKGKMFYACSAKQCDYFMWKDSSGSSSTASRMTRPAIKPQPAQKERVFPSIKNPDSVKCDCGLSAKYLLSKTAKNSNRGFFKCSKSYKPCVFFKWEDEVDR